jgi:hypothetical protein
LPSGPRHRTRAEIARPEFGGADRTRLKLLEQQRLATLKARESSEGALREAERKLGRLPRLVRGRRRDELRAAVGRERSATRLADEKLASLQRAIVQARSGTPLEPDFAAEHDRRRQDLAPRRSADRSLEL